MLPKVPTVTVASAGAWMMSDNIEHFEARKRDTRNELKCPGVGRDAENEQSLCFYFNRKVTDDEMRYLHEVMQRAVACSR